MLGLIISKYGYAEKPSKKPVSHQTYYFDYYQGRSNRRQTQKSADIQCGRPARTGTALESMFLGLAKGPGA